MTDKESGARFQYGVAGVALFMMAGMVLIDTFCPPDLSLFVFNVFPICLWAWYIDRRSAFLAAILCGVLRVGTDQYAKPTYSYSFVPLLNVSLKVGLFVAMAYLVSRLRETVDHLKTLSRTDSLTGLLNSGTFIEMVDFEIDRAQRSGGPLSLVYLDLDNFKAVNDTLGHAAGDKALKAMATTIQFHVRTTDFAGRLGGDEFAILLPDTNQHRLFEIIERLRTALGSAAGVKDLSIALSIGAVTWEVPPESARVALQIADQAMYEIKQSGKNDVNYRTFEKSKTRHSRRNSKPPSSVGRNILDALKGRNPPSTSG